MAREGDRDRHARSVFVGNIPFEATETELREIFEQAGPIVSFRIVHDRETGKPKGFGFIEYQDTAIAASCCRNLNNVEYNGRPLRVGPASTDGGAAANSEIKALQQALGNAVQESPYGQAVEPAEAPEAISKAVSSLPPEQMFELMKQMKICIQNNPNEARNMLLQNPQLAYALLQAQIVMKIVDPAVAMALLHRERETQPPIRSEAPPAEPVRPPVAPNPLVSPTGVRPLVAGGLLGDGPPKSAPAGDPRLQQAPPQTQSWPENRAAAPSNIAGPPPDAWSAPTKPPGFDRDQRGGPPPRSGEYDRGSQSWDRRDSREQSDSRSRSDPRDRDPRERGEPRDRSNPRDVRNDPRDRMDPRDRRGAPPHGGFSDRERDRGAPPSRHVPPARNEPPPRSEPPPHISRGGPPSQQQYPPRAPPAQAASPAIPAALAGADSEKAALIMQVLQLTDEQIQQLPPEQRQSIILLKQQLQQR